MIELSDKMMPARQQINLMCCIDQRSIMSRNQIRMPGQTRLFAGLLIFAILLELLSARLAYFTVGAVFSSTIFLAIGLNVIPPMFFILQRRALALALVIVLVMIIVPYQMLLGYRWWQLQHETASLIPYIYQTRLETGAYPVDLAGYTYRNPALKPYIHYRADAACGGFCLSYHVGTPNTSHHYQPQGYDGQAIGWFYMDD